MSDLQALTLFRLAQANGTIRKLTKTTHDCASSSCDRCIASPACSFIAKPACHAVVDSDKTNTFDTNYRNWAKRTTFYDLPYLQQHYPELLI